MMRPRIHELAQGRRFRDAIPDGQDFRLRFLDGYEIVIAWGEQGPEVKADAQGVITAELILHPQFRYVRGKTVKAVMTDGSELLIFFTDGHCLRSDFRSGRPGVAGVDVNVRLPPAVGKGVPGIF